MAEGVNKVILIGNLGRDPEMRSTQSGNSVCNFSMATTTRWKNGEQWEEQTEWHKIVVWGKQAENCDRYLRKGSRVFVEGKIQTRTWTGRDGDEKRGTEIVAQRVVFLGSEDANGAGGRGHSNGGGGRSYGNGRSSGGGRSTYTPPPQSVPDDEDSIPF